tara:strand:+ start:518 stop:754 length:237 start_codon:yes stop_codon:yes gene_type:complete
MNVIDGSPCAAENPIWRKAAMGRTATSLHAESVAALHAGSPDIALSLIDAALADGAIDPLFRCHREAALRLRRRMQRI